MLKVCQFSLKLIQDFDFLDLHFYSTFPVDIPNSRIRKLELSSVGILCSIINCLIFQFGILVILNFGLTKFWLLPVATKNLYVYIGHAVISMTV